MIHFVAGVITSLQVLTKEKYLPASNPEITNIISYVYNMVSRIKSVICIYNHDHIS